MATKKPISSRGRIAPASAAVTLDSRLEFAERLRAQSADRYVLKLYVTGSTFRSSRAVASIRSLCDEHLAGRYRLDVIDIYQHPQEAVIEQIIAAPTLVKEQPKPLRRLVGDLCDRERLLLGLNLQPLEHPPVNSTLGAG